DIDVRLAARKFFFTHYLVPRLSFLYYPIGFTRREHDARDGPGPTPLCAALDDFFGDVIRRNAVLLEFHCEDATSLCHVAQCCRVAKHFTQRDVRPHRSCACAARLHPTDDATTGGQVAYNRPREFVGNDHFDFHGWLQQHRLCCLY